MQNKPDWLRNDWLNKLVHLLKMWCTWWVLEERALLIQVCFHFKPETTSVTITSLITMLQTELKAWRVPVHIIFFSFWIFTLQELLFLYPHSCGLRGSWGIVLLWNYKAHIQSHGLSICSSGLDSSSLVNSVTLNTKSVNTRCANMTSQNHKFQLELVWWRVSVFPVLSWSPASSCQICLFNEIQMQCEVITLMCAIMLLSTRLHNQTTNIATSLSLSHVTVT